VTDTGFKTLNYRVISGIARVVVSIMLDKAKAKAD